MVEASLDTEGRPMYFDSMAQLPFSMVEELHM
jgi:hypothetical protein